MRGFGILCAFDERLLLCTSLWNSHRYLYNYVSPCGLSCSEYYHDCINLYDCRVSIRKVRKLIIIIELARVKLSSPIASDYRFNKNAPFYIVNLKQETDTFMSW